MDATHFIRFSFDFSGFYYTQNFLRILRNLLHLKFFSYKTTPHKGSENSPFSRNLVQAERKRRGQTAVMWTEYHKKSDANYIGWINLIWISTTHRAKLGLMRLQESYIGTFVTLVPSPLKWLPQASLGAFPFTVWMNWNVHAKNRRSWQVNFIDSGLKVAKTTFQTFLRSKSVLFKLKCQILRISCTWNRARRRS